MLLHEMGLQGPIKESKVDKCLFFDVTQTSILFNKLNT